VREVERSTVVDRFPDVEEYGTTPVPPLKRTGTSRGDLELIRSCLSQRLNWLALELTLNGGSDEADVVQELWKLDLLDEALARFAMDLISPADADISSLPGAVQEDYIDRGWRFANRIRPVVFDRAVRRDLRRSGWFVADFAQPAGHRPDYLASANNEWFLIAPRVALDTDSASNEETGQIAKTRKRWERDGAPGLSLTGRVIVIPRETEAPELDGDPHVIKRPGLLDLLGHLSGQPEAEQ
jgi:hypothetical protein